MSNSTRQSSNRTRLLALLAIPLALLIAPSLVKLATGPTNTPDGYHEVYLPDSDLHVLAFPGIEHHREDGRIYEMGGSWAGSWTGNGIQYKINGAVIKTHTVGRAKSRDHQFVLVPAGTVLEVLTTAGSLTQLTSRFCVIAAFHEDPHNVPPPAGRSVEGPSPRNPLTCIRIA
ncbi:MAG TPA: hypothetical protein VMT30_03300 [Candidatus Saccharimonadia bacterium]|nr:hypothetical protein [Candidatus Saccharimonadia bacterium]